jgi:hypothetical protein
MNVNAFKNRKELFFPISSPRSMLWSWDPVAKEANIKAITAIVCGVSIVVP